MNIYPQFYKNSCKCLRRESDTIGYLIEIPEPSKLIAIEYIRITMKDKTAFDKLVDAFDPATEDIFSTYRNIYYQIKSKQAAVKKFSVLTEEATYSSSSKASY